MTYNLPGFPLWRILRIYYCQSDNLRVHNHLLAFPERHLAQGDV
uniref:Uncharacterized protein n=1 Tax=Anguilla anguilla TaxID=7936 RepID=A0A0E9WE75_ANGAN